MSFRDQNVQTTGTVLKLRVNLKNCMIISIFLKSICQYKKEISFKPIFQIVLFVFKRVIQDQSKQKLIDYQGATRTLKNCLQMQLVLIVLQYFLMIHTKASCPLQKSIETTSFWSQFQRECSQEQIQDHSFHGDEWGKSIQQRKRNNSISKNSSLLRPWTSQDQNNLISLHKKYGNRWTSLAKSYPGMSENSIKNRFYSRLRKSVRKLNKMIDQLKLKHYNKFKLNIIFQLSNMSESKLLQKEKISSEIFHFYKEYLYDLIEFTSQSQSQVKYKSSQESREEVEDLILPLVALQNLFRLVRGERAAKGKKKNIAYLRQFNFKLNLHNSTFLIITKQNIFLQNFHDLSEPNPNDSFFQLKMQRVPQSMGKTYLPLIKKSEKFQKIQIEESVFIIQDEFVQRMDEASSRNQKIEREIQAEPQMWKDFLGFQMKQYDLCGYRDTFHDANNPFGLLNVRDIDFDDGNGIW